MFDGVGRDALRQIDAALNAATGVEAVRALVLDLAVRGRLLGAAKLASSSLGSEPFPLPSSWSWVRLEDLTVKLGAGSTPLGGKKVYQSAGIKFLRSQNVWNDGLRLGDVAFIDEKTHAEMRGTWVEPGDILLNITGASIGRSAVVPDGFDAANVSQHVAIVRLADKRSRRFVHLCITSPYFQRRVMDVQVGVSREGLSMKRLRDFVIPLPPPDEQKHIVAKVDQLMALCDELEAKQAKKRDAGERLTKAALAALTSSETSHDLTEAWQLLGRTFSSSFDSAARLAGLRQAILDLASAGRLVEHVSSEGTGADLATRITEERSRWCKKPPVDAVLGAVPIIPQTWVWAALDSLLIVLRNGVSTRPEGDHGVPVLRISAVRPNAVNPNDTRFLPGRLDDYKEFLVQKDDLLFTRYSGNAEFVGACGVVPSLDAPRVHPDKLIRGVVVPTLVSPAYVAIAVSGGASRRYIDACGRTTAGQVGISGSQLKATPIPLPPLEEQRRIVLTVTRLMRFCADLERALATRDASAVRLAESVSRSYFRVA